MFLKSTSEKRAKSKKTFYREGAVGTEAVAAESERIHKKHFAYPEQGFVARIEHSLLYAMVREPDIFPPQTVLKAIDEEDFTIYFHVRPKPKTIIQEYEVSYAQLTALLATAGEEWAHDSEIPPTLCRKISQSVIRYADEHGLDRKTEIDDLLQPLYKYIKRRESTQSIKMLPWLVPALGATVVIGNPLPFYAVLMAGNVIESNNIAKGATSTANAERMKESGERLANVEQSSLLAETYGPEEQDDEEVIIDWS